MPRALFGARCDLTKVTWFPVLDLAREYQVSATAAALRLLTFTPDRVALVCCKDGLVEWSQCTRDFGRRPAPRSKLDANSLAYDFFTKGSAPKHAETVQADAWIADAGEDEELVEHVLPMAALGRAMCLLWRTSSEHE